MLVTVSQHRHEPLNDSLHDQIENDDDNDRTESNSLIETKGSKNLFNKNNFDIPAGYVFLSDKYFKNELIPPPLVSKAWLQLLTNEERQSDHGESEYDSLPLQELRNKWKKKALEDETQGSNNTDNSITKSCTTKKNKQTESTKEKPNEFEPVNRKRGRPRKLKETEAKPQLENSIIDEFDASLECDSEFWNEASDVSEVPLREELQSDKEDTSVVINYREHDYFKQIDTPPTKEKPNEKIEIEDCKKKKKKKKTAIQGVKVEDSKTCYPCLECGKSFSAASTLKNHLRIHNGTLLICTECHKGFTTKYLLKCHMRIHSGDLFMCHKCGKGFTTAELLKVHSRGHTGDRPFVCNVCEKSFPSASNLSQHKFKLSTKAEEDEPRSKRSSALKNEDIKQAIKQDSSQTWQDPALRFNQTHDSEKKFLCFQCGSSFNQKRCLDGHMLTHAEKNHICTVCGKLWARKSDLSEHMRVHTGVKPYCCNVCPQKFTQASSLKRHQIVHMEVKPIQCLTCSKMFKCQEYYKRHLRKHEKEADYLFNNIKRE